MRVRDWIKWSRLNLFTALNAALCKNNPCEWTWAISLDSDIVSILVECDSSNSVKSATKQRFIDDIKIKLSKSLSQIPITWDNFHSQNLCNLLDVLHQAFQLFSIEFVRFIWITRKWKILPPKRSWCPFSLEILDDFTQWRLWMCQGVMPTQTINTTLPT